MSRSRVDFGEPEYMREIPRRGPPVREYDDLDIRFQREQSRQPAWMEENRRPEPGSMVLRAKEIETFERPRQRSPSPSVRVRQQERTFTRARSVSPGRDRRLDEDLHIRHVTREQSRGPPPVRFAPSRSPSPHPMQERERIRIIERERERATSPAPPPRPPTPKIIKGPTIEREVITHYRDIDHGVVAVRPPSPPPPVRRDRREAEIDIWTSRNQTEVDIRSHSHSRSRGRSASRERPSRPGQVWDDEVLVQRDNKRLHVDIERRQSLSRGRRAQSAAPPIIDYDDEAYDITSRIDARGKMGEARGGVTKDWAIIDVPPGTERVRMDGVGGAGAEVSWQKYSGVRRTKFIPEREEKNSVVSSSTSLSDTRGRDSERRLSVQIVDKDRRPSRDRDIEIEKITDRRISIHSSNPPPPRRNETWTEITKDLVSREAIKQMGYDFEETEFFYYIVEYLAYEDVLRLVQLSDRIRQARKDRARDIAWEREHRDDWEHRGHHHHHKHRFSVDYDDERERMVEREVIYDSRHPGKGYRY